MTLYAHTTDGTIGQIGALPALWLGPTRWHDWRGEPETWATQPADWGWLPVTETPRPEPVDGGVHESAVELVDGLPVRVWTWRAWTAEEIAAQAHSVDTFAAIEAIVTSKLLPPPAEGEEPTFDELAGSQAGAIFTGQRFVWTDGNVWEANTGPLNSNATPDTCPQGYSQITGLPPDVPPWEPGGTYKADDLREHGGVVYRCIQPHTNYDPGHTPNLTPSLWTPQG